MNPGLEGSYLQSNHIIFFKEFSFQRNGKVWLTPREKTVKRNFLKKLRCWTYKTNTLKEPRENISK